MSRATFLLATFCLCACAFVNSTAAETEDVEASNVSADSWYPRTVTGEKGTAVLYAPQIDAWTDFETITAWVAFRITRAISEDTYYGSLKFDARTDTDVQAREVLLHDVKIHELSIDGLDEDSDEYLLVHAAFSATSRTVPLDLVLEYLPKDLQLGGAEGLNTEPPAIFWATSAAVLLNVDSEPVFVPVDGGELQFVINTNWDVLRVGDPGPLYFCYQQAWLTANSFGDQWTWATALPEEFGDIPDDANWLNVQNCMPDDSSAFVVPKNATPKVFYTSIPAELLLFDGRPEWEPIGNEGLSYATNTQQEVFRVGEEVYLLISGRWFESRELDGPWKMVTKLPEAFQEIPSEGSDAAHPKSYVRKSVPGTQESWEAALVASIPRKAEIARGTESALNLTVTYAGEPTFTMIETTDIEMAVNTSYQVFRYGGAYYLCHNATWLTAFSANGPWQFADFIPEEFSTIPSSSPAYNTTFVTIDSSNEESINYEYTSGYEGAYVSESTVVQGTGHAGPTVTMTITYGMYYGYPYYPYYPWPPTYGYGSWYDPSTGRYGESIVAYGPYGAAGSAAVFNPETGAYARGRAVWDNDEFSGRGFAYNPNSNTSIARNRYVDFEDNEGWSQNVAQRGDEWRYSESEWEDGRMKTEFESSYGTEGEITRQKQGDTIVSEGSITGENRSATFDSVIEDGSLSGNIQGSEGGIGEVNRELDDGEISGSGTFTRDGNTIETDVTRTAEGVQRDFETSQGGQGKTFRSGEDNAFVLESGSGDVYAGRNGNVYQKNDDGWSAVENQGTRYESLPEGGFANAQSARDSATTSGYSSDRSSSRYGNVGAQLERDYQSRQNGFNRYAQHQSTAGARGRSGNVSRRRRR